MRDQFEEVYTALRQGEELVIVTIISDSGSTPRTSGSKMVVYPNGHTSGTIGGGAVEGDAIQTAQDLFQTQGAVISSYDLNQTANTEQMDLICGGRMQVLLEHVAATDENTRMYGMVCEEMQRSRALFWIGRIKEDGDYYQVDRAVQTAGKGWVGSLRLQPELQRLLETGSMSSHAASLVEIEDQPYIVEPVLPPETVHLIGAGHVSGEIAALTRQVGFRTLVFDDRAEFADAKRFSDADGVHVCPGYTAIFEKLAINATSYIIIVTRGHRFDQQVLAQALRTEAGYIGMIGSRRKRESIYSALLKEGFKQRDLDKVHCPIGLPIAAETPAEIGISVVAQLIQHRARRQTHG